MWLVVFFLSIIIQQSYGQVLGDSLSSRIYFYVQDSMPDYNFIVKINSEQSSYLLQEYINNSWGCVSDFNGDEINDYALLLRDSSDEICLFWFSITHDLVTSSLIDCFGVRKGKDIELKVFIEPKGKWEAIDTTIKVSNDGIIVDDLKESISKAYYWKKESFVKFLYD